MQMPEIRPIQSAAPYDPAKTKEMICASSITAISANSPALKSSSSCITRLGLTAFLTPFIRSFIMWSLLDRGDGAATTVRVRGAMMFPERFR